MFVVVLLCCAVLCKRRPCDGVFPRQECPNRCGSDFIISEVIINCNRLQGLVRKGDDDDDDVYMFVRPSFCLPG